MKILPALLAASALAMSACTHTPAADPWEIWVQEAEAGYATDAHAVLKVNEAIYIAPDQTVWLTGSPDDPASYRWMLTEPQAPAPLSVGFDLTDPEKPAAQLVDPDAQIEIKTGMLSYAVDETISIAGRPSGLGTDDPRLAVFIYNQRHPAAAAFTGLDFYPYDPAFRVEADIIPATPPEPRILQTERGLVKQFFLIGHANFSLGGADVSMPLYGYSAGTAGITSAFAPFMDETTGTETYGVGRYLDIEIAGGQLPDTLTIDFNYAYNPLCARSEHYNCPLVDFTIPAAIRAGEQYAYDEPH